MYPDLSYLFHDIFGTPVDNFFSVFKTFGLLLATALFFAWMALRSEMIRLEKIGILSPIPKTYTVTEGVVWKDIILNGLLAGFVLMKIPYIMQHFPAFQSNPAGIIFSLKGNLIIGILVALIAGAYLYYTQSKEKKEPGTFTRMEKVSDKAGDIVILAGISGVIGAKLFSISENMSAFFQDPLGQLISGNGLNILGGLIVAFIVVYWYIKKLGIKPLHMMDIAGICIFLGYAIGRIGCQLSGDGDWGIVAAAQPDWWFLPDWLWSYTFPHNVNNDGILMSSICDSEAYNATFADRTMNVETRTQVACGMRYAHELPEGVYPTSVYETLMSLTFFVILRKVYHTLRIAGLVFFLYMIINGIERWCIENIRVNDKYELFGLMWSQAQYISVLFVLVGVIGTVYIWKNKARFKY